MPGKLTVRNRGNLGDLGASQDAILFNPNVKKDGGKLTARNRGKLGDLGANDNDPRFNPPIKKRG